MPTTGMIEKQARVARIVLWVVCAFTALTAFTILLAAPKLLSGASSAEQVKESQDIAGCRGLWATDVNLANAAQTDARGRLEIAVSEFTDAAVARDAEQLASNGRRQAQARADIEATTRGVNEATDAQTKAYQLSLEDPRAFLRLCAQRHR